MHTRRQLMETVLTLFAVLAAVQPSAAQRRAFDVIPPDRVPFNYPGPPQEGRPDYVTVAEDGQSRCVIVRPSDASSAIRNAAAALGSYLQLATGGRFAVLDDGKAVPAGMAAIHVGDTSVGLQTKLDLPDVRYGDDILPNLSGYLIETLDAHTAVIRGRTDTATVHGVVGFLRRYVGVRQYWPGEPGGLGDVIPSRSTLRVPQVVWRDWPYFFSRTMSMRPFSGSRGRPLDFYRRNQTLRCGENYSSWLPPQKYGDTNPEYFPLVSGTRVAPPPSRHAAGWQPCVSNPDVVRIMGEAVAGYFQEHPDAVGVNFAINDGGNDCTCKDCCAMDAPNTDYAQKIGMSDRYMKLTNRVCERVHREFPGKLIVFLAYAAARRAPTTVDLNPMVVPVLTVPGNAFQAWDEWMQTGTRHMGLYLHHDDLFFILPKFDLRQSVKRIRYVVASGRARIFYMEMHTQWPFNDLVPHVVAELLWDPRRDVDALLDEYYTSFYGPAAEPMRDFHRALETGYERWLAEEGEPHWHGNDASSIRHARTWAQFRVLTTEEASRAVAALARAAEAAKDNAKVAQRVEVLRLMFKLQELYVRQYWTSARLRDDGVRSEADAERVVRDARTVTALSREIGDYIRDVLEKPPADSYRLFKHPVRRLALYDEMSTGQPTPELLAAISAGVDAATNFLRDSLGPEKSAVWWRRVREAEKESVLAAAFESAEMRSAGVEIENLVPDPGFEETAVSSRRTSSRPTETSS